MEETRIWAFAPQLPQPQKGLGKKVLHRGAVGYYSGIIRVDRSGIGIQGPTTENQLQTFNMKWKLGLKPMFHICLCVSTVTISGSGLD